MTLDGRDGRRGIGALLRDLAEGSATLVRDEVRSRKIEVGGSRAAIGEGHRVRRDGRRARCCSARCRALAGIVLLIGDQWLPARSLLARGAHRRCSSPAALAAWFATARHGASLAVTARAERNGRRRSRRTRNG